MLQIPVKSRFEFLINHFANGDKEKFANKAGINIAVVEKTVRGRGINPSFSDLQNILYAFEYINPGWLIAGQGEPFMEEKYSDLPKEVNKDVAEKKGHNTTPQTHRPDSDMKDLIKAMESMAEIMKANAEIAKLNAEVEKAKAEAEKIKAEADKLNAVANERNSRGMENLISVLLADSKQKIKKEPFREFTTVNVE